MSFPTVGAPQSLFFSGKRKRNEESAGPEAKLPRRSERIRQNTFQYQSPEIKDAIHQLRRNEPLSDSFIARLCDPQDDALKAVVQDLKCNYGETGSAKPLAWLKSQLPESPSAERLHNPLSIDQLLNPNAPMDAGTRLNIFQLPAEVQKNILRHKLTQHPEIWEESMDMLFNHDSPANLTKAQLQDLHLSMAHGNSLFQPLASGGTVLTESVRGNKFKAFFDHLMNFPSKRLPINQADQFNLTPLDMAAMAGNSKAMESLLNKGAQISKLTLKQAALFGEPEALETLLEKSNLDLSAEKIAKYSELAQSQKLKVQMLKGRPINLLQGLFDQTLGQYMTAAFFNTPVDSKHFAAEFAVLSKAGVDIDVQDEDWEYSALHVASHFGHSNIAKVLLQTGADFELRNAHHQRPLHLASKGGHHELVKALLHAKVNVNAPGEIGATGLHYAAENGDLATFNALVAAGAKIKLSNHRRSTTLHYAAKGGNPEIVDQVIAAGVPINAMGEQNQTALMDAASAGHLEAVNRLLNAHAYVDYQVPTFQSTALHWAAAQGHLPVVNRLLTAGANWKMADIEGRTALHRAVEAGSLPVVNRLLMAGLPVDAATNPGRTALQLAALSGNIPIMKRLIEAGAQIDKVNRYGHTPLFEAVSGNKLNAVNALLVAGATVDHWEPNEFGLQVVHTPLHYAAQYGDLAMVNRLLQWGANPRLGTTLVHAAANPNPKVLVRLLKVHAPLDAKDENGMNALHMAALCGNFKAINPLLKAGIPLNKKDTHGNNALHWAAKSGSIESIKALVDAKIPVDQVNDEGDTALHKGIRKYHGNPAIGILIEAGGPLNVINNEGHTALYYAEKSHDQAVAQLLRAKGALSV